MWSGLQADTPLVAASTKYTVFYKFIGKKTTGLIDLFGLECLSLHFRAGDFDHDNFFFQIRPLQSHDTDAPLVAHDL